MTKLQAIRWFSNQLVDIPITIAAKRLDGNWAMYISPGQKNARLSIPKDFTTNDKIDKEFRKNFVGRCKLAQGFSNVTLAMLHEFGHWETRSVFNIIAYDKFDKKVTNMQEYMQNPYEQLATQWAICWLQVPYNRRLAKEFEDYFFGRK